MRPLHQCPVCQSIDVTTDGTTDRCRSCEARGPASLGQFRKPVSALNINAEDAVRMKDRLG